MRLGDRPSYNLSRRTLQYGRLPTYNAAQTDSIESSVCSFHAELNLSPADADASAYDKTSERTKANVYRQSTVDPRQTTSTGVPKGVFSKLTKLDLTSAEYVADLVHVVVNVQQWSLLHEHAIPA